MGLVDMTTFENAARADAEFTRETRYLTGTMKIAIADDEYMLTFDNGALRGVETPGKQDDACDIVVRGDRDHWTNMLADKPRPFYQCLQSTAVKHGLSITDNAITFAYLPALNQMMVLMRDIANGRG
ncbi:MAG: hypothetical protein ROR55_17670 [Devosia sp.]